MIIRFRLYRLGILLSAVYSVLVVILLTGSRRWIMSILVLLRLRLVLMVSLLLLSLKVLEARLCFRVRVNNRRMKLVTYGFIRRWTRLVTLVRLNLSSRV